MKFKVMVNGGNIHYRVNMAIYCDSAERVESIRKFAKNNKFHCTVEIIDN